MVASEDVDGAVQGNAYLRLAWQKGGGDNDTLAWGRLGLARGAWGSGSELPLTDADEKTGFRGTVRKGEGSGRGAASRFLFCFSYM